MKTLFLLLPCFIFSSFNAQVFSGGTGNITNGSPTSFQVFVSNLPALDSTFGLESVCLDITHPQVDELHIFLRSPTGIEVELTGTKSCKGADFSGTCFESSQLISVTTTTAPYTGTFKPVGNLGRFNRMQPANGSWTLVVDDFIAGSNTGSLNSWSLEFGSAPGRPVLLQSSNLPLVFINTPGAQALTTTDILIDLGITDNGAGRNYISDPKNNYAGKASCRIRGASSKMFEKNNLKIELRDSAGINDRIASLLGMPPESDWVLTACYTDKTLVRNPLSHHIFSGMGHYSPRGRFVELVLNGEYFGTYILMEQIKRGKDRVDITKLTPADQQQPAISGGYILQIDRLNAPGWYSLHPGVSANGAKFFYQYNYPRAEDIVQEQKDYIRAVLDSFELAVASPEFTSATSGYRHFINEDSFIDYLILNELSKNADAFKLSTYLFKDNIQQGGKIHSGPAWDYDLAWHNCNFGNTFSEEQWQHEHNNSSNPIPTWWRRMMSDPFFQDKLNCRYHSLRKTLLSEASLFRYIDDQVELLQESRDRNFRQFPIIGAYIWPNPQNQDAASYEAEIIHVKDWIKKRGAWLDNNIPGKCLETFADEKLYDAGIKVFPNPGTGIYKIVFNESHTAALSARLFNTGGTEIKEIAYDRSGNELTIDLRQIPAGIYILQISTGSEIHYLKLLMN
jgi:subtilisin-like proprotein convertase family protein